ncbi:type IV toxin-antitoxin system AbiEi family antitoxin domain-containing protein [Arabiibacter massiliensis]|uniref:type IV toxin-antitoxin system AbiEi family antitoxin domain-containing protein n=1 Tax=Arabiibacter massiliensis TaxID=1870985 RepID=UPI00155A05CE|nr:hypothetical protein [Arabiibacter massiliensis]
MAAKDFLENTAAFTIEEYFDAVGRSPANANLLSRAKGAGKVLSPMRGAYVSNTGRYRAHEADPYLVATKLGSDVVFAYDSALALHVGLHNATTTTSFYATGRALDLVFLGRTYRRYPRPSRDPLVKRMRRAGAGVIAATSKEQTIIDCLQRPDRCGGVEALFRSLSVVRFVDSEVLADLASGAGASVSARCGWVLERKQEAWDVPAASIEALREAASSGPLYFGSTSHLASAEWDGAWNLYLPAPSEDMEGWLEG